MINGLSKYSKNGVAKAFEYLLRASYKGNIRSPKPRILSGDPSLIIRICKSLSFSHKYTSGVLSFAPCETAIIDSSPGLADKLIKEFEDFAFAGIPSYLRCIACIEHRHTGRLEIHYIIPRVHLGSGKYFNPFPPGHQRSNDIFIDYVCEKYGLTNPRSPLISRLAKIDPYEPKAEIKKKIHGYILKLISERKINNSTEILNSLKELGYSISRQGDGYISIKIPGQLQSIRLRGEIYKDTFFNDRHESLLKKTELAKLNSNYERLISERSLYITGRHNKNRNFSGDQIKNADSKLLDAIDRSEKYSNSLDEYYSKIISLGKSRERIFKVISILKSSRDPSEVLSLIFKNLDPSLTQAILKVIKSLYTTLGYSSTSARGKEIQNKVLVDAFHSIHHQTTLALYSLDSEIIQPLRKMGFLINKINTRNSNEQSSENNKLQPTRKETELPELN